MKRIEVYAPALCCPTGVCGPSVDPELVRFAADLDWLKASRYTRRRALLRMRP